MSSYKEVYEVEFITRTKKFLEDYQKEGDYKLTLLLNCMVGLIFIPNERKKYNYPPLWKTNIQNIPVFKDNNIYPFIWTQNREITLETFLRKLRNGIGHQNIEPINEGDHFVGVTIWNVKPSGSIDFKVKMKRKELLAVASFIADQYLAHIDEVRKNKILSIKED